jgi:enterochelin esterase-like enzyme
LWAGVIPDPAVPALRRSSIVYLPPHLTAGVRYPVVYLLQGFRGSPWQYPYGLQLAAFADQGIESGALRPFIAVAPPAGLTPAYDGEWAGVWETYLVRDVVPWVDSHLPTIRAGSQRAIVGLSAGGFGAVDIGLRQPGLFKTLESWSGYFTPFRDGPFRDASARTLANHDPSLLVRAEVRALRRLGTRFYLSAGTTSDRWTAARTSAFANELAALRLPHAVYLAPGGHNGRFWRSQFPRALRYALPAGTIRQLPAQASLTAR